MKRVFLITVVAIVVTAFLTGIFLFSLAVTSPTATNVAPEETAFPVTTVVVRSTTESVQLELVGTVEAERQVALSVGVTGRVARIAKGLRPGRVFQRGETLVQIDPRDYEAALAAERARVRGAELELAVEQNRQKTAQREVDLVGASTDDLALRKPYLARAQANLTAAQKAEERAALNVSRARLTAPFNGIVVSESVDVGQWVSPGNPIVQLVGTDAVRIMASIPVDQLGHIDIPEYGGDPEVAATVFQEMPDGSSVTRSGQVTGVSGALDARTRTATLMVSVANPYDGDGPPLLPGAMVRLVVTGQTVEGVVPVPHKAVHENSKVWVVEDGALQIRPVSIGWRTADLSYIVSGLKDGARVITTNMALPVEGMKVQFNE